MANTPNSFGQAQAVAAQYWFERVPYTWGPNTLAASTTSIFTASRWTPTNAPMWQARLDGLWATQNSSVRLYWRGDSTYYNNTSTQGYTDASPQAPLYFTGSVYGMGEIHAFAPAISTLSMTANNTSAAAIDSFNIAYTVGMKRLTVAEKVAWSKISSQQPPYAITDQDRLWIENLPLNGYKTPLDRITAQVQAGAAPLSVEKLLDSLRGLRLGDDPGSGLYHVTATTTSATTAFARSEAIPHTFLVLEELAVEGGTTGAQAFNLYGDRDANTGYINVSAASYQFASDHAPKPFIPALQTIQFRADTNSGTVTNAPVRIRIGRYRLTDAWLARLDPIQALATSQSNPGHPVDPALFSTVQAGI